MNKKIDENCIFCKIVEGIIPASKIVENDFVIAFNDINPLFKKHILVIPKKHIESFDKLEETEEDDKYMLEIQKAIKNIAKLENINESGYRVVTNIGEDAGQTVKHLHFHVLGGENMPFENND